MPYEQPVLSADRPDGPRGTMVRSRSPLAYMPVVLSPLEERLLEAQQQARAAVGAPPLEWSPALTRVARGRWKKFAAWLKTHGLKAPPAALLLTSVERF